MTSNNPFAQRLTRKGSAFSGLKALYASLIIGFIISLLALLEAALSGPSASGFNGPQIVLFIVALSAVIAVPLLITNVAATLAVTYTQSREFPFLLLTNLPAKEIVQGYLYAAIYRCRALIGFAISLSIGLSLTLRSGGDQFTLYPATLSYGLAESISRHIIMGVLIAAVTCAIALLGASVGIMLGLWWRQVIIANGTAVIVLFMVTFWWLDKTGDYLKSAGVSGFNYDAVHPLLFIPLPIFVSWIALLLSRHWARKAHFKN